MLQSPPSRRRGLKYYRTSQREKYRKVASFAEAWIEIYLIYGCSHGSWSPPSRRRGLKYSVTPEKLLTVVASFAEAWIEMVIHNIHNNIHSTSPPSRRRGLKYRLLGGNKMSILSPPSRRRGLKLQNDQKSTQTSRRLLRGGVD